MFNCEGVVDPPMHQSFILEPFGDVTELFIALFLISFSSTGKYLALWLIHSPLCSPVSASSLVLSRLCPVGF